MTENLQCKSYQLPVHFINEDGTHEGRIQYY